MVVLEDRITLDAVEKVLYSNEDLQVGAALVDRVDACYRFLEKFAAEKVRFEKGVFPESDWQFYIQRKASPRFGKGFKALKQEGLGRAAGAMHAFVILGHSG